MSETESNSESTVTPRDVADRQQQQQQSQQEPERQYEQVPDDHPLTRTLATLRSELSEQKNELKNLRAKAKRLDEIEEAQKSEAEKAADRIAKAEAEAASVPAKVSDALRTHLATLHEISADDVELFLTSNDPEILLKQVTRLVEQKPKRKTNHVPSEGTNPAAPEDGVRDFARQLFGTDQK